MSFFKNRIHLISAVCVSMVLFLTVSTAISSFAKTHPNVKAASFYAEALGAEKDYYIYLPPGYEEKTDSEYPSVYLLHGYDFARNNPDLKDAMAREEQHHWIAQEQVPEVADCLFTTQDYGALLACLAGNDVEFPEAIADDMRDEYPVCPLPLPPMIIVMPDGDSSFYVNRLDGKKTWPPLDGPEFVNGIRKGATGQYETYIYRDLVDHIDSTYRTIDSSKYRGIGGFSMGGIGSMNILLGHPDVFCSVTSLSAVFTLSDLLNDPLGQGLDKTTPEIRSVFSDNPDAENPGINVKYLKRNDPYYRLKNLKTNSVHIYYDAGSADFFSGMYNFRTFRKFQRGIEKKGLTSEPANHIIPARENNGKGMHTGRYWRSRLGVVFAFHAKSFGLLPGKDE